MSSHLIRPPAREGRSTLTVIPSISFPAGELQKISGIQHYEERLLFVLLWLADPALRIVYVTSAPIDEAIIDYYLSFLDDPDSARQRLILLDLGDTEARALSSKLLERPDVLKAVRAALGGDGSYLLPFNVTEWEAELAQRIGVPIYGAAPELAHLGSKSGARNTALGAGVPVPEGAEDLFSLKEVERAIAGLRERRPDARAVVIKLNNGFAGQGNAILELDGLRSPLDRTPTTFCASEESWTSFKAKFATEGGIVEELLRAPGQVSPSVQMHIAPGGRAEVISTHDQILGGPDNQVYMGCSFPARPEYRNAIKWHAALIGETLADAGVIGSFGMDFIVVPRDGSHDVYLGEINLRMGGTTHPFQMAQLVTAASYDAERGELLAEGTPKSYLATDNLKSEAYRRFTPASVIELVRSAGLAFDRHRGTGVTLHLLGSLPRFGKLGALCIGNSHEEARRLLEELLRLL